MASALVGAVRPMLRATAVGFHQLEARSKYTASGFPKNYLAIAVKPAAKPGSRH